MIYVEVSIKTMANPQVKGHCDGKSEDETPIGHYYPLWQVRRYGRALARPKPLPLQ